MTDPLTRPRFLAHEPDDPICQVPHVFLPGESCSCGDEIHCDYRIMKVAWGVVHGTRARGYEYLELETMSLKEPVHLDLSAAIMPCPNCGGVEDRCLDEGCRDDRLCCYVDHFDHTHNVATA